MEDESGEGRDEVRSASETRGTWFAEQLGPDWTEVEPGIYRFTGGDRHPTGTPETPVVERTEEGDLIDALQPTAAEPEPEPPPKPVWLRLGRREG
jgi:hypothetical protein